jgi:hypothetical protein
MDGQSNFAQPNQPSLEHGAEQSLLHYALQELKDLSQFKLQHNAIATENPSTSVDLTLSQTFHADRIKQTNVHNNAEQLLQIAQTAILSQFQSALTSPPSLEEPAEDLFLQLAKQHASQSQFHFHLNHFHQPQLEKDHNLFHHNHFHQLSSQHHNHSHQLSSQHQSDNQHQLDNHQHHNHNHQFSMDTLQSNHQFSHQFSHQHQLIFALERTVTTKSHALLTLAMQRLDNVLTTSITPSVTMETSAQLTVAHQLDALTHQLFAMTTMLAQLITATPRPDNAHSLQEFVKTTTLAQSTLANQRLDVFSLQRTVTMELLALLILAVLQEDASTLSTTRHVMTTTHAQLMSVTQRRDA